MRARLNQGLGAGRGAIPEAGIPRGRNVPLADALPAYRHKPSRGKVVLRVGGAGIGLPEVRFPADAIPAIRTILANWDR